MRAGDALRVSTIRLARAAIHNAAIEAFTAGRRDDLVKKESLELAILADYAPAPLTDDELRVIVGDAIVQVQVKDGRDIGRVMAAIMPKIRGRADGQVVNRLVRERLAGRR